mmetsp:Transcript_43196/g.91871  ORF Transcript_43196/g.91871 Transcript_43196/m.91871 type:complete len:219 (-) Transcript_43196:605-1261(-)
MTLVGVGGTLVPGTRLGIRVRFPIYDDDEDVKGAEIVPCHRVCCALVGEEYSISEGDVAADNPEKGKKRIKTRSYMFDSAHEMVEFGYTEAVSMGLVIPLDCPVTVKTDLVEVVVSLKVEFTVSCTSVAMWGSDRGMEGRDPGEFNSIRLDLPCDVVHEGAGVSGFPDEGEEEERHVALFRTMQQFWKDNDTADAGGFDDTDIEPDLKFLSLRMISEL